MFFLLVMLVLVAVGVTVSTMLYIMSEKPYPTTSNQML